MNTVLVPVVGCLVSCPDINDIGIVTDTDEVRKTGAVTLRWLQSGRTAALDTRTLIPAFAPSSEVQEIARSLGRESLGEGYVVATRTIGHTSQILVHFFESGRVVWVPWQNLRIAQGVRRNFAAAKYDTDEGPERFRLRSLAQAIVHWNENTGALTRLSIDPLPHQINLVHHILASGNLNWLIADDVGLGKTIEVGMLLAALNARKQAKRVLLVTPAGLVRQWQEELSSKFALHDFLIYGKDIEVSRPEHWKQHDRVIASMDLLKSKGHMESILLADKWDIVIFDEAHRLSRRQEGMKYVVSDRYELASALRTRTDAMLLLTATPHQGRQDKFRSLLHLLRPELGEALDQLENTPELLSDMVFRNRKEHVTHMDGTPVFKGKIVRRIEIPSAPLQREFDRNLQRYFKQGYAAAKRVDGKRSAIGFVMTTYRKLASSSVAAIQIALEGRLARVRSEQEDTDQTEYLHEDDRFESENTERNLHKLGGASEFFTGEARMLEKLIKEAHVLAREDSKLDGFLSLVREQLSAHGDAERLLIFTEYRATQNCLVSALRSEYGDSAVALINGEQRFGERESAITAFKSTARFLVSTEAGGEGVNMQQGCHIMINYDLPWNPMRLVQRIGRLYRYGQTDTVVVLNLAASNTVDERVVSVMYERFDQVSADLSSVFDDFGAGLQSEWLGEIAAFVDFEKILDSAEAIGGGRTEAIDAALDGAKLAVERQDQLFGHVSGFDPSELEGQLAISSRHVESFVLGMCRIRKMQISRHCNLVDVWQIQLDPQLRTWLGLDRTAFDVTFSRSIAASDPNIEMIDMESSLLKWMLDEARKSDFGGRCVAISDMQGAAVMTAMLRWQNDRGMRFREEYTVIAHDEDGIATVNPDAFSEWLLEPANNSVQTVSRADSKAILNSVKMVCDDRLAELSTNFLHPESVDLSAAAHIGISGK